MISFRASELDRVLSCPGSMILTRIVAPREGDDGDEGTALHHASAVQIVRDLGGTAPDGLPPPDPRWPTLKFSKWIADYYVRHIQANVGADWSLEVECPLAYEFQFAEPVETTVVEWTDGVPTVRRVPAPSFTLSGHIDCVAINADATEAIGWDLKTGRDPVDAAEQNWQMLGYIALLVRAYPTLRKVTFHVVQPRNDEDEGFPRVSSVEVTNLDAATAGLIAHAQRAVMNSLQLSSGRVQCNWCPAATQCPVIHQLKEQMKLALTPTAIAAIKKEPDDTRLADWVMTGKILDRPMKDAAELAKARIAKTGEIEASDGTRIGIKVERGSYKILNHDALWKTLHSLLPADMLAACAKWSFSEVKDRISQHLGVPKTGKAAVTAESVFDDKVRPHVEQGERRTFIYQ